MLNIILGILMLSLASASGFMIIEQMSLSAVVSDVRENASRLDVAANAVSAKLGAPAGSNQAFSYVPAAKAGTGPFAYSQLPDSIPGLHSTVAGVPFRYCPFAPEVGADVVSGGYLVRGPAPSDDVAKFRPAGLLIAAGIKSTTPPSCDAVRVVDGRLYVKGGLVRMVSGVKGMSDAQLTDGSSYEMWVAPGGTGTGADAQNPGSLVDAMNVWKSKLPKSMVIHVPSDAVFADVGGLLSNAFAMGSQPAGTVRSSKLSIVAGGAGRAIISANATFDPQGGFALVGVNMPVTVLRFASHNQGSIQNAQVAAVDVQPGSSVAFNGGVSVQGGGINVSGDATVQGALEVVGSSSPDLISIPSGGRLILSGAGLTLRGGTSGIALAGDLAGNGNIVGAGAGVREIVRLVDGGRMAASGSFGGVISGYSVLSDGMPSSIGGTLSLASGTNGCWGGGAFAFSTGETSRPVVPAQIAPPTAGADGTVDPEATKAFIANSEDRARATALLGINRSSWTCGA